MTFESDGAPRPVSQIENQIEHQVEHQIEEHAEPVVRGGLALWALFVGLALVMVGNGLNLAVLGVRLVDEGFGTRVSGLVMAAYFAGFLIGPPATMRMAAGVGHIRVFAGLATIASSAILLQSISVLPLTWALTRFVFGFCMAGLYVVIESWLSDASTPSDRGRTLAVYLLVSMGGLGLGQLIIAVGDTAGFRLFVVAAILVSMSLVPMTLAATTHAPPIAVPERLGLRELARLAPTGVIGMACAGLAHGTMLGLTAVYATSSGFDSTRTAVFIAVPTIGSLAGQWPIGWVSDHAPRRGVILVVAALAGGLLALLAITPSDGAATIPLMFALGAITFPLYSLLLSYTLDWVGPGRGMGASAMLLRVYGTGAIVGPIATSMIMAATTPTAFFWVLVAPHAAIVLYVGYRLVIADGIPIAEQGRFVQVPTRATALAVRLTGRVGRRARDTASPS